MTSGTAFLVSTQHSDGGWGYAHGEQSFVEATAAALMALRSIESASSALSRAVDWLTGAQHADGGWGVAVSDRVSGWQTAWAVLALQSVQAAPASAARGAKWLLETQPWAPASAVGAAKIQTTFGVDAALRGWPWRPGEASFVEPTALAMLALVPSATRPDVNARLVEGASYLINRRCSPGGWNVGNPSMLGAPMSLRAHPTAWALLALQRCAPDQIQAADLSELRREMHRDGGAPALAWGLLALRSSGQDDPGAANLLAGLQNPDGSWNADPYQTATALAALAGTL
jgi:hypothetical protein